MSKGSRDLEKKVNETQVSNTVFGHLKVFIKPWPNGRNISTQHIATLLGATGCVPVAIVLRHVGCCWLKFENGSNLSQQHQHVATCRNKVVKRMQHVAPNNVAIQLFRQRLSHKSVKAYTAMPIGIMAIVRVLALLD